MSATVEHQPIVYGPVKEGELSSSGKPYPKPGYGWSCTCGQSGFGYVSEGQAGDWAERHVNAAVSGDQEGTSG